MYDDEAVKPTDLVRRLRRLANRRGWSIEVTEGGNHTKLRLNGCFTVLPRHAVDLKPGTYRNILKALRLSEAELEE